MLAMPSTGRLAERFGVVPTIRVGMVIGVLGFGVVGAGVDLAESRLVVGLGLFLIGSGVGVWDVAMNLEGASVERLLGQTVMPQFHAAFSGGTVASALVGSGMSWASVPLLPHLLGSALLVTAGRLLGDARVPAARGRGGRPRRRIIGPPRSGARPDGTGASDAVGRRVRAVGLARAAHPAHRARHPRRRLHRGHRQRLARRRLRRGPRAAGVGRGPRLRDVPVAS